MPKPTQGARFAAGKKKGKKRPESRPIAETAAQASATAPVQTEENGNGHAEAPVLQFRPKAREAAQSRMPSARSGAAGKAALQPMDYSYVFTDLRIIGVLVTALFLMLIALTFVIR